MNPAIKYFTSEKNWCIVGAMIAVLSVAIALWFLLRSRQPFQTGIAWPFLILGIVFFIICASVAFRSNSDASRVSKMITGDRTSIASQEIPRMTAVMRNFTVIISLEIAFLVASISLLLLANLTTTWKGAMTGLLVQASWLLIFDMFARARGAEYLTYLESIVKT
jgi:hypothetical protein